MALSLQSTAPITLSGSSYNAFVIISAPLEDISAGGNGDGICDPGETCKTLPGLPQPQDFDVTLTPSTGTMTITRTATEGGSFTSSFNLQAFLLLDKIAGTGPDTITGRITDTLTGSGSPWVFISLNPSVTSKIGYPLDPTVDDPMFFPSGDFLPGIEPSV